MINMPPKGSSITRDIRDSVTQTKWLNYAFAGFYHASKHKELLGHVFYIKLIYKHLRF